MSDLTEVLTEATETVTPTDGMKRMYSFFYSCVYYQIKYSNIKSAKNNCCQGNIIVITFMNIKPSSEEVLK